MHPIAFKESNCTFAQDQPEYIPLPAHKDADGRVTTCWEFTFKERLWILFSGRFYLQMLTFNKPLQPLKMSIKNPLSEE